MNIVVLPNHFYDHLLSLHLNTLLQGITIIIIIIIVIILKASVIHIIV